MSLRRRAIIIYILVILYCAIGWGQTEDIAVDSATSGASLSSDSSLEGGGQANVSFQNVTLTADIISIDTDNQLIKAEGSVRVVTPEGVLTAFSASFNQATGEGYLDCVTGEVIPFHFCALSMTIDGEGTKHLQRASLTTCERVRRPHYRLLVRSLAVYPDNNQVDARGISLEVRGFKLFTVPRLHGNLKGSGANGIRLPTYTAGVSAVDGFFVGAGYSQTLTRRDSLNVNARIGTKGLIRGKLSLDHRLSLREDNDALLSFIVSNKEDVINRVRTDGEEIDNLLVSRLPAVEARTRSIPFHLYSHPLSARFGGGYGYYEEDPTGVNSSRGNAWGIVSTPKSPVGPLLASAEFGARACLYPGEQLYTQIARLTVETPPAWDTYCNVTYQYSNQTGSSPFLFDTNLLPESLYTELEFRVTRNGRWRADIWHSWDFDDNQTWDAGITAIYHLDCVSFGLTYDITANSFELGFRINAFGNFRRGSSALRFVM